MGNTKSELRGSAKQRSNVDYSRPEVIRAHEELFQKLTDAIDALDHKNNRLTQEKEMLAKELTVCKSEKHKLEEEGSKMKNNILQLKMKLETAENESLRLNRINQKQGMIIQRDWQEFKTLREAKQAAQQEARRPQQSTQETQTDQDDDDFFRPFHYQETSSVISSVVYSRRKINMGNNVVIHRPSYAEPPGQSNVSDVRVINTNKQRFYNRCMSMTQVILSQLEQGEKLYFHGSTDSYVTSILYNGIDVTKSTRPTDFACGNGFYVTKNLKKAIEWSKRVAKGKRGRPALIAFKISESLRKEEPHLSLKVNTTTNRKWWECVVSYFRQSEMSQDVRKVLQDVKFIKGPVANNRKVGYDEIPRPLDFTQLCIRDEEYARRFGCLQNISFVVFDVNN